MAPHFLSRYLEKKYFMFTVINDPIIDKVVCLPQHHTYPPSILCFNSLYLPINVMDILPIFILLLWLKLRSRSDIKYVQRCIVYRIKSFIKHTHPFAKPSFTGFYISNTIIVCIYILKILDYFDLSFHNNNYFV